MPPLQTTYSENLARFILGMIPDMRTPGQDRSLNVEPVGGIGFGKAVGQGTAERQIRAIATGQGTAFIGVTVLDTTQLQDSYPQYATARVRTKGPVVVAVSGAVTPGASAYVVPATGAFSATATGNTLVGKFETAAADGGLAVLNLT